MRVCSVVACSKENASTGCVVVDWKRDVRNVGNVMMLNNQGRQRNDSNCKSSRLACASKNASKREKKTG